MKVSLLTGWRKNLSLNLFFKKITREKIIINVKKIKIYNPLDGSLAKVWTEFNIPDLTKKVPVTLEIKVIRDKIKTQLKR